MAKFSKIFFLFLFVSTNVSAQNFLNLDEIQSVYDAPINKKEIKILNYGFLLGTVQPVPEDKMYTKGLVPGSHFKEAISFVTRITKYNDPIGKVSYQTWIPKHYAELSEEVSNKYEYLGNFEFSDREGLTYDLYEGNGFTVTVHSFTSGGNMVGNIVFRPL